MTTARRAALAVAAVACVVVAADVAHGARPATPVEQGVWRSVVQHMRDQGVAIPDVPVYVAGDDVWTFDAAWVSAPYRVVDGRIAYGQAELTLAPITARAVRELAGIRRGQGGRLAACWVRCSWAAYVLLHEAGHVAQLSTPTALEATEDWIEGTADAVAVDQLWPFMGRRYHPRIRAIVSARHDPVDVDPQPIYAAEVNLARSTSAARTGTPWRSATARRWRLAALTTPWGEL